MQFLTASDRFKAKQADFEQTRCHKANTENKQWHYTRQREKCSTHRILEKKKKKKKITLINLKGSQ